MTVSMEGNKKFGVEISIFFKYIPGHWVSRCHLVSSISPALLGRLTLSFRVNREGYLTGGRLLVVYQRESTKIWGGIGHPSYIRLNKSSVTHSPPDVHQRTCSSKSLDILKS